MKPGKHQIKFTLEKRKDKETGEVIIKNVPIFMQVTFAGQRLWYYTNYRIDQDKWKDEEQRVKNNVFNRAGESAADINRRITNLSALVDQIFRYYENLKKFPTLTQLKEEIRTGLNEQLNHIEKKEYTLFERFGQYIEQCEVSPLRKKQLKSSMNHLQRFNEKLTFQNFNPEDFRNYLRSETDEEGNPNKSLNTIIGIMKRVKCFYTYAVDSDWTESNPFKDYSFDKEVYGTPIYLKRDERDILINAKIPIEILDTVRDIFILQCFIGARISDFQKLTKKNIVNGAIEYVPAKTSKDKSTTVRIPLSKQAMAIINKYDLPSESLVPYIHEQRYNEYLKDLFQFCKLNRPVVRLDPITRKNETLPLYKLATSHMARRTFVGLLHKVAKNEVIASMSGHVANSRAFARYYKIDEDQQNDAIKLIE